MDLAEPAGDGAIRADPGGPSRMQVRVVLEALVGGRHEAQTRRDQLDDALGVVEVVGPSGPIPGAGLGVAGQGEPEAPPLPRALPWRLRDPIALADLEDRHVVTAVSQVGRDHLEQAADEALAKDRVLARQRVTDVDRRAARGLVGFTCRRAVVPPGKAFDHRRRDERERDGFGQAGPGERGADGIAHLQRIGR